MIPKKDVLMGSYDLTKSIASLRRNGYLLLTMILSILCYEKEFKRQCVPEVDVEHPRGTRGQNGCIVATSKNSLRAISWCH